MTTMSTRTTAAGASGTTAAPAAPPTTPTRQASSTSMSMFNNSGNGGGSGRGGHNGTPPAAALTTVWKPPCSGGPISWDRSRTVPQVEAFSPCLPEGWAATGYFSPAICPSGYVSVCGRFRNDVQGPPVEEGETAVMCGPSGYTCNAKDHIYAKSGSYDAPVIQIRWQASDLSVLQTHQLSPTTTSQTTTTGDSIATAAADDRRRMDNGGGGGRGSLPPGVIAAIIVGSMVAVALMVLAGLLIYRHRQACVGRGGHCRRHSHEQQPPLPSSPGRQWYPGNLGLPQEAELPGNQAWMGNKNRPRFYSRRGKRDVAAAAVTSTASNKWQQQEQQQQQKHRSIQELPGHDIPWEMGDCSRPSELTAQEAVCGPPALPREPSPLYHHHYHDGAHHPVSEITLSTMADSRASPTPVSAAAGGSELEELRARHARIEARRERLRELQLLDEEEGRVRRRLAEIQGGR
ncbi:hypothetical protein MAPG_06357 [Magnaporthiopsis poae ATCC 64411]|uniref:Uncharacterized protein n=1 Tax=Magnaporthiopsis poae (strain ATCC 64411 / 73-15) TaxID=644358 RepID=A0A0C4E1T6_MAGP6|nr:hypothetical protein MAPG_06357 [Magnaporthiopsis poae ATCC 64411]